MCETMVLGTGLKRTTATHNRVQHLLSLVSLGLERPADPKGKSFQLLFSHEDIRYKKGW